MAAMASPMPSVKWTVAAASDSLTEFAGFSALNSAVAESSGSSQEEMVITARALPAIPQKILQKMYYNWEFIEFGQLLSQSGTHNTAAGDTQRVVLFPGFELVRQTSE